MSEGCQPLGCSANQIGFFRQPERVASQTPRQERQFIHPRQIAAGVHQIAIVDRNSPEAAMGFRYQRQYIHVVAPDRLVIFYSYGSSAGPSVFRGETLESEIYLTLNQPGTRATI